MIYPTINHFNLTGISLVSHLYNCDNTMCSIILSKLSADSTGVYLCEISADAPAFMVSHRSAKMTVGGIYIFNLIITYWINTYIYYYTIFSHSN